jgi:hypothetical protein
MESRIPYNIMYRGKKLSHQAQKMTLKDAYVSVWSTRLGFCLCTKLTVAEARSIIFPNNGFMKQVSAWKVSRPEHRPYVLFNL